MASSDTDFDDERKPETAIWPAKPEVLIFESEGPINLRFAHGRSTKVFPRYFINHRQPEILDETGNTYIAETILQAELKSQRQI